MKPTEPSSKPGVWKTICGKGSWSLADQALFAVSNFALNIFLARWLDKADYGAFAVAFTVFLLVGVVFNGLMVEPMLVFGSGKYRKGWTSYLNVLTRLHWKWGWAGSAALIGVITIFYQHSDSFGSLLALAFTGGLVLYQWLMRRACYVEFQPRIAASGGLIYFGTMMTSLAVLNSLGQLSAVSGVLVMGGASLVAGLWIQRKLNLSVVEKNDLEPVEQGAVIRTHAHYGKWAVLTNLLSWMPGNLYLLILPLWKGEEGTAELKAAFNLVLPIQQFMAAVGPLLLPAMVRAREGENFTRSVWVFSGLLSLPVFIYTLAMWFCGDWVSHLVYGGKYPGLVLVVAVLGLQTALGAVVMVIAGALRALELPKLVALGYLGSTVLCLGVGLPLTYCFGVVGAAWGMLASISVNAVILVFVFQCNQKKRSSQPS